MKTLKQVAMAEKLSTPQLQQAVKDGTIESWIGIPMIQERMKEQKQAQAAAMAQQPKQPPIAEQVMQEASGVGALPSNLPQQYAQGGIIGYAEGGETDELYQQYLDDAEEEEFQKYAAAMRNRTPAVDMSYSQVQGAPLRAARQSAPAESKYDASGHKYDEIASKRAEERGMPAGIARFMLHKETGGLKNPDTATSKAGAYGPAQIMPATAKSRGINYKDPVENVLGGVDYLAEMYHKYGKNPELALAAYNAGPGRVDRALKSGQGIAGLPTETKGYVKFAKGGIAHFDGKDESLVKSPGEIYDTVFPEDASRLRRMNPLPYIGYYGVEAPAKLWGAAGKAYGDYQDKAINWLMESPEAEKKKPIGLPAAIQGGTNPRALENASMVAEKKYEQAASQAKQDKADAEKNAASAATNIAQGNEATGFDDIISTIKDNIKNREKQRSEDKWLGLLSAGLGMMGGTSPYGAVNVGQGAMYGLQQYGAARKAATAGETADLKNLMLAQRYKDVSAATSTTAEQRQAASEAAIKAKEEGLFQKWQEQYMAPYVAAAKNAISPEEGEKIIASARAKMASDPFYKKKYESIYPGWEMPTASATMPTANTPGWSAKQR